MEFIVLFCITKLWYNGAVGTMYPTYCIVVKQLTF